MTSAEARRYALTPDIAFRRVFSATPQEYALHIKLLQDIHAGGRRVFDSWTGKDMTDLQHEVWVSVMRGGLAKQDHAGNYRLTKYGEVYLFQRVDSATSRDAQRRRKACKR